MIATEGTEKTEIKNRSHSFFITKQLSKRYNDILGLFVNVSSFLQKDDWSSTSLDQNHQNSTRIEVVWSGLVLLLSRITKT